MENKGDPGIKENQRGIGIPKTSSEGSSLYQLGFDQDFKNTHLAITAGDQEFLIDDNNIPAALGLIKNLSGRVEELNQTAFKRSQKIFRSQSQFKKLFFKSTNFLSEIGECKIEKADGYLKNHQFKNLYSLLHDIQTLPNFLLKLDVFKTYQACQIFVHEKGSPEAYSYLFDQSEQYTEGKVSVKDFNSLFNGIKKSKNKQFNRLPEKSLGVETLGAYLAKQFTSKKYNLILIVSRNDFLPPNDQEILNFNNVALSLFPVIEIILLQSKTSEKTKNLLTILESFPIKFALLGRDDEILFSNYDVNSLKDKKETSQIALTGGNKLSFLISTNDSNAADIYHYQRVSLLGELLNTLSHELSNPLFGLSLATSVLQSDIEDEETVEFLTDIGTNIQRSQTIIKNFSNLYSDEENSEPVDLKKIIEETVILTKSESKGIPRAVTFSQSFDSIYSKGNPTWISQILFNLLVNGAQAIKAKENSVLKDNMISVEISIEKDKALIIVSDTGTGIKPNNLDKVFKPFYTTKSNGTGLGLNICQSLAKKLNGTLELDPNYTDGARFKFTLPIVQC